MGIDIRDYLKQFRSEPVLFRPNRGNACDALIAHATIGLLRDCGVAYLDIDEFDDVDGQVVLYGGGGNLVELYDDASSALSRAGSDGAPMNSSASSDNAKSTSKKRVAFR